LFTTTGFTQPETYRIKITSLQIGQKLKRLLFWSVGDFVKADRVIFRLIPTKPSLEFEFQDEGWLKLAHQRRTDY
jgi:hypothetical protein